MIELGGLVSCSSSEAGWWKCKLLETFERALTICGKGRDTYFLMPAISLMGNSGSEIKVMVNKDIHIKINTATL